MRGVLKVCGESFRELKWVIVVYVDCIGKQRLINGMHRIK